MPSDFKYSANFFEVYSPPSSVRNRFTCLPDSFSLKAFHSLNFSRPSDLYFYMYSSVCLVGSSMKCRIYWRPPMAVSSRQHMSECRSCWCSVAREVVGVKRFRANLRLMQLLQSHFLVIFGALVFVGKISKAFTPMCARRRCHNIRLSAACRDACPVVLSTSRQLSWISVYSVDSGARSRTNSSSTWGLVKINLPCWL